jgi:hypothetical protein
MNNTVRISLRCVMLVLTILTMDSSVKGQSSKGEQLWTEIYVNYSFANIYELQNRLRFRTNLDAPKWRALDLISTLDRTFTQNIDGNIGLNFSYVFQNDTINTLELRPSIGTRIHFTPNQRVLSRLFLRVEQRNLYQQGTSDWQHSLRMRVRPELLIPLNKKSYYEDKMFYGIVDAEWFIVPENDVDERFANRFRIRVGIGYRLSRQWRFEGIYMHQLSKNKIGDDFDTSDNIVRLRLKYFPSRQKENSSSQ